MNLKTTASRETTSLDASPPSVIRAESDLPAGQFPGPWSVENTEGGHLVVRDADGTALAFVYVEQFGSVNRNGLSSRQALAIAESIARIGDFHMGEASGRVS
jgi:hypothetical protein